ncbi:MAG TPA: PaaI family thioesterase [Candidatus Angelobacter sp.]|jgi:uncharacterized protein (TIGR00369 family)|nr:PaaI family thioesterase [Candidatus Angelobacter sp.]
MAKRKLSHGHAVAGKPKPRKNHCFACGHDNPQGMRLKFSLDEESRQAICHFKLARKYTGPPGHAHGGIIATILDEAMGKVNKFRNVLALTGSMEIKYLKPVPLGQPLTVSGSEQSVDGRRHINMAEISNAKGEVLARSTGTFIAIDPEKMFARHGVPAGISAAGGPNA